MTSSAASRPAASRLADLQRRVGRFPIELPAAAMMGGAVAFVMMVLPAWRFEGMISASGLPALVSAAAPPLGQTARLLVALFLGGLASLGVWAALRALDTKPEAESDFPSFRAEDLHPDAPRRRPILAGAEFGTPVGPAAGSEPAYSDVADFDAPRRKRPLVSEALPSFLAPQPPAIGDFVHEPVMNAPQDAEFEDAAGTEAEELPEPAVPLLRSKPRSSVSPADIPSPEAAAPDVPAAKPSGPVVPDFLRPPEPAPLSIPRPDGDDSVSRLMSRLETGLSRRGEKPEPGPAGYVKDELARTLDDLDRAARRSR